MLLMWIAIGISEVLEQTLEIEMWRAPNGPGCTTTPFETNTIVYSWPVYLWLVVSWPKPMTNGFFQHQSLSRFFNFFERVGQLIWPWTTCDCTGSWLQTCFHALLQKHPQKMVGWLVDATFCHIMFDEFGWRFGIKWVIKPTSSAKNRLRFCLFPFHAEEFSICVTRWIQKSLPNRLGLWSPSVYVVYCSALVQVSLTVSSSENSPWLNLTFPRASGQMVGWKRPTGNTRSLVFTRRVYDRGKCRVFLGWETLRTMELLKLPSLKLR